MSTPSTTPDVTATSTPAPTTPTTATAAPTSVTPNTPSATIAPNAATPVTPAMSTPVTAHTIPTPNAPPTTTAPNTPSATTVAGATDPSIPSTTTDPGTSAATTALDVSPAIATPGISSATTVRNNPSVTIAPTTSSATAAPDNASAPGPEGSDRLARLALNHAVEPADPLIGRILERYSPEEVLAAIHADQLPDLEPDPTRRERLADRCTALRLRLEPGRVETGIAAAEAVGARFIVPADQDWPYQLDDLGAQRPIGIWAIGRWPPSPATTVNKIAADMISVVGARACTGYGTYIAGAIGADLASAGHPVVSGAALGIDAAAHRGAIAVGGPTVAVLACGIDRVYPRVHEALLRTIAEHGAVLCELPPGAAPTRFRFLHRNRIIAALSVGTVVVEAALRSGSLVTARLTAELGRVVMAVPGPVTSDQSAGAHELIRDGATLVTDAAQVREACSSLSAASLMAREFARPSFRTRGPRPAEPFEPTKPFEPSEPADPIEELVAEALPTARAPTGADVLTLARTAGLPPDSVFAALGRLAASGRAVRAGGGWMLATADR